MPHPTPLAIRIAWVPVLAAVTLAGPLLSAQPAATGRSSAMIMLDEHLSGEPVELLDLDRSTLTVRDRDGRTLRRELREVIAMLPSWWHPDPIDRRHPMRPIPPAAPSASLQGVLELVDGQRVPGRPVTGATPDDDSVLWTHSVFGPIQLSLETVRTMTLAPDQPAPASSGTDDLVLLKNGDRLAGFVEALQPEVVVSGNTGTVSLPVDTVAAVRLLNEQSSPEGMMLWTDDRSVIAVRSAEYDEDSERLGVLLRASTDSEQRYIERSRLVGLSFDAGRVIALSSLPIARQTPIGRSWGPPIEIGDRSGAPFGAADVRLNGPTEATWELPRGAVRLAGWAALRPEALLWGDCIVTIEALDPRGRPIATSASRLNGESPLAPFNLAIEAGSDITLRLRVDPGEHGPIQDWVTIHRAIVLRSTP